MTVYFYIDVIFAINFAMDGLVLFVLERMKRTGRKKRYLLLGAAIGATLSCLEVILNQYVRIWNGVWFLFSVLQGIIIVLLAFGYTGKFPLFLEIIQFYSLLAILAGLLNWVGNYTLFFEKSFLKILLSGVVFALTLWWVYPAVKCRNAKEKGLYQVEIICGKSSCKTVGFLDTGNHLTDVTGTSPVVICEYEIMREILKETKEVKRYFEIPFRSLGEEHGSMTGIQCDRLIIQGEERKIVNPNVIVAIYYGTLSGQGLYHLILHKGLM